MYNKGMRWSLYIRSGWCSHDDGDDARCWTGWVASHQEASRNGPSPTLVRPSRAGSDGLLARVDGDGSAPGREGPGRPGGGSGIDGGLEGPSMGEPDPYRLSDGRRAARACSPATTELQGPAPATHARPPPAPHAESVLMGPPASWPPPFRRHGQPFIGDVPYVRDARKRIGPR